MKWLRVLLFGRCNKCENPRKRGFVLCREHLVSGMREAAGLPPTS